MPATPQGAKALIESVGALLVRKRGRQTHYSISDIQEAVTLAGYPVDRTGWAACIFSAPREFQTYCEVTGHDYNYFAMRAAILPELNNSGSLWRTLDLSSMEWPDLSELASVIEVIDVSWFDST